MPLCKHLLSGRTHPAVVSGFNEATLSLTVEWFEGNETKGKEVEVSSIADLPGNEAVKAALAGASAIDPVPQHKVPVALGLAAGAPFSRLARRNNNSVAVAAAAAPPQSTHASPPAQAPRPPANGAAAKGLPRPSVVSGGAKVTPSGSKPSSKVRSSMANLCLCNHGVCVVSAWSLGSSPFPP